MYGTSIAAVNLAPPSGLNGSVCPRTDSTRGRVQRSVIMVEIHEILCPTDFSDASRHALEHAVVIAKWYDSRITALHVVHAPVLPQPPILGVAFADATTPAISNYQEREQELRTWSRRIERGSRQQCASMKGTQRARFSSMRARIRPNLS